MSKEVSNRRIIQTLWNFTHSNRKWVFFALLSVIFAEIASLFVPLLIKDLFNTLAGEVSGAEQKHAITIILYIAAVHILSWFFWRTANFSSSILQSRTIYNISNACEKYLLNHSYQFFSNNFAGSLVRKLNRLPRAFESLADLMQYNYIPLTITTITATIILGRNNLFLGLSLAVWIVVFLVVNYWFARWRQKYERELAVLDSKSTGELADQVTNNENIRLFASLKHESARYGLITNKVKNLRFFVWMAGDFIEAIQVLFIIIIEVILYWIAIRYWQQGSLTIGDFALIQGYLIDVFNKIWRFGRTVRDTYSALADGAEMVEILDTPHEITDSKSVKKLHVKHGEIDYQAVNFSFNKTRAVLKNFNLQIKAGEHVAFVGPSGAGKSTIVKILFRLFDLDHGRILIDGVDIAKVTQNSLRENIALVPQEPILFHRSLMDNIRYGNRDTTDEQVIKASKQAHCHEFISVLPEGYETFVGERGIKLSGGERQRVAIARAFLKNAPILVLDEATSSLDSESESLIQDALNKLMKDKTTLVIAHRLSTIMNMDRIIVIEDGVITADGTHHELLDKSKTYKKLWEIQAGGFLP